MQSISNKDILGMNQPQNDLPTDIGYSYSGGYGYTSAPTVSFSGGSGSGAAATAIVQNGRVVAVNVTNQGTSYASAPSVSFTGGGSTGAAATATIEDGKVVAVNVTNSGNDRKLTITDNTVYGSGDSRKMIHITVYDAFGNKVETHIDENSSSKEIDVIEAGLNPSEGLNVAVTVVSALGKRKDGSMHGIGEANKYGKVNMEY